MCGIWYVCAHVYTGVRAHACECGGQVSTHVTCLSFLHLIFEATSLTKPTLDTPTMTPRDPPAFAHSAGITDVYRHAELLCGCWGSHTLQQVFYPQLAFQCLQYPAWPLSPNRRKTCHRIECEGAVCRSGKASWGAGRMKKGRPVCLQA